VVTDQFLILAILSPTKEPPVFYGHQSNPGSSKINKSLQEMEPRLFSAVTSKGLNNSSVLLCRWTAVLRGKWVTCHSKFIPQAKVRTR